MIRLFINGLAASAGGGPTYLRNVIPHLSRRLDVETTVLLNPAIRGEFGEAPNISLIDGPAQKDAFRRFVHEQTSLPKLIRRSGAHVLVSAGNFALWNSPVAQILLSRNSLYTSADFLSDVRARGDRAIWADTLIKGWLAKRSIRRAEMTIAPSEAFARDLTKWSGKRVRALHHGFDVDAFTSDPTPLSPPLQIQIDQARNAFRLLFVSHYNYYRNFETLFRALPILSARLSGKQVKLFLTCKLSTEENPGLYQANEAMALIKSLRSGDSVVELGTVPYRSLHLLYRACHVYVTPAYAESFAHPLVEAMSNALPVVASDLPVHREICADAGLYFPRFNPMALVERVLEIHQSPELAETLSRNGLRRAREFSWSKHVEDLVAMAKELANVDS
jgi:glycosyltransferase involved in cell wall biosynthesis